MRQLKLLKTVHILEEIERIYMNDIRQEPFVTPDEECTLAERIREGDKQALDKLVKANLRFVISIAKQYQNKGLSFPDLVNEGNIGLIKAGQRYDEKRGFKFVSYAVWWIEQAIKSALSEKGRTVRIPGNIITCNKAYWKAYSKLEQEFERDPTFDEVRDYVMENTGVYWYDDCVTDGRALSLNKHVGDSDDLEHVDLIRSDSPTDHLVIFESLKKEINCSLKNFKERDSNIVKLFFGIGVKEPCTKEELSIKYDLTAERIRQIIEKVIDELKKTANPRLKEYFEYFHSLNSN